MGKIILIGGGEIKNRETLPIDQQFVKISGGQEAVIGFFPTAAGDSDGYIETFTDYFQNLGCQKIIPIKLSELSLRKIKKLIIQMTGIYLGGGSTHTLIETFIKKGVDRLIEKALEDGAIVAGMSAGALATCDYYIDPDTEPKKPKIEKGLGFQKTALCVVHYENEKDEPTISLLKKEFPQYKIFGIKEKKAILIEDKSTKWLG